jgi:hypothetical protein
MLHQTGQLHGQLKVLFFAHHGHLQALKVIDLKLLCLSQLCGLKDREIKVAF